MYVVDLLYRIIQDSCVPIFTEKITILINLYFTLDENIEKLLVCVYIGFWSKRPSVTRKARFFIKIGIPHDHVCAKYCNPVIGQWVRLVG